MMEKKGRTGGRRSKGKRKDIQEIQSFIFYFGVYLLLCVSLELNKFAIKIRFYFNATLKKNQIQNPSGGFTALVHIIFHESGVLLTQKIKYFLCMTSTCFKCCYSLKSLDLITNDLWSHKAFYLALICQGKDITRWNTSNGRNRRVQYQSNKFYMHTYSIFHRHNLHLT